MELSWLRRPWELLAGGLCPAIRAWRAQVRPGAQVQWPGSPQGDSEAERLPAPTPSTQHRNPSVPVVACGVCQGSRLCSLGKGCSHVRAAVSSQGPASGALGQQPPGPWPRGLLGLRWQLCHW